MNNTFLVLNIHNLGNSSQSMNSQGPGTNASTYSDEISLEKTYFSSETIIESAGYFSGG